jgi:hypothetical protein
MTLEDGGAVVELERTDASESAVRAASVLVSCQRPAIPTRTEHRTRFRLGRTDQSSPGPP